jgi:hypothetical protein
VKYTTLELVALTKQTAGVFGIDPVLACSIVEQESAFNPYAFRPESESGFVERYGAEYHRIVLESASKWDDRWIRFEDAFYASYGLMQTLYCVIIENFPSSTEELRYPTALCDPWDGLKWGCQLFAKKLRQAGGRVPQALLLWNGGGNKNYPAEVLARQAKFRV